MNIASSAITPTDRTVTVSGAYSATPAFWRGAAGGPLPFPCDALLDDARPRDRRHGGRISSINWSLADLKGFMKLTPSNSNPSC
jgi:hypothetical protein